MKWKMKQCRKGVKGCPMEEPDARECPYGYVWVDEGNDYVLNCISNDAKLYCLLGAKRIKEGEENDESNR